MQVKLQGELQNYGERRSLASAAEWCKSDFMTSVSDIAIMTVRHSAKKKKRCPILLARKSCCDERRVAS